MGLYIRNDWKLFSARGGTVVIGLAVPAVCSQDPVYTVQYSQSQDLIRDIQDPFRNYGEFVADYFFRITLIQDGLHP